MTLLTLLSLSRSHDMDANSRSSAVNLGWKVAGMTERDALLGRAYAI